MPTSTISASGSKKLVITDRAVKEQFYINPDLTTLTLGSTSTFSWTIDKKGKYPVLNDIKIRFKCKNSSANDTWDYESLWDIIETLKIKLNDKEVLEFKDNLTREVQSIRKLRMKSIEEVQHREWQITRGAGTAFKNSATIAVSTTSDYYHASLNDVCDVFHDLRLCPLNKIGFEMSVVNDTATNLLNYLSYDNSTGSEALSTYFSLVNVDIMLEVAYYQTPQTSVNPYCIPTHKYDKRNFSGTDVTTNFIATANQSFTIDLDDWHKIEGITKVHIYGRDAAADGMHTHYLGLGVIDHVDIKRAGKTEVEYYNQYHLIEHIDETRKAEIGNSHWLLPNHSWVTGEDVPYIVLNLTDRNRFVGEDAHVHEGISNKGVKHEIVLYNGALTDANMTRLSVILESKHYIRIDRSTGRVTSS